MHCIIFVKRNSIIRSRRWWMWVCVCVGSSEWKCCLIIREFVFGIDTFPAFIPVHNFLLRLCGKRAMPMVDGGNEQRKLITFPICSHNCLGIQRINIWYTHTHSALQTISQIILLVSPLNMDSIAYFTCRWTNLSNDFTRVYKEFIFFAFARVQSGLDVRHSLVQLRLTRIYCNSIGTIFV